MHGKSLEKVKNILSKPPIMRYFDQTDKTQITLQCDASAYGLGACLLQNGQSIQYAHRALSEKEKKNYAQIEKEMWAIVFGLDRFERYVFWTQSHRRVWPQTIRDDH